MEQNIPTTIDEYICACAPEVQPMLIELRDAIKKAAPMAGEKISWGMATFTHYGNLVHFSSEKKHIGFHPNPSAIEKFCQELAGYKCSKGTIQLPYSNPLPLELIDKIVRFRVEEQESLDKAKKAGIKEEPTVRIRYAMPDDILEALNNNALNEQYESRPPYQRNDYIAWITNAKRPETRTKRLNQMLEELRLGDLYMGRAYNKKK